MVSGEVKGQHVLLWSVWVFCCLLPAAALTPQCTKLDFPTARAPQSGHAVTLAAAGSQTLTIPFSITDRCTNTTQHPPLIITVNKWNTTTGGYHFFCKFLVKEQGNSTVLPNRDQCKGGDDKGHYSLTTFTGRSNQSWQWQVTYKGTTLVNTTVHLHVQEFPQSTLPGRDIGSEVNSSRNISLPETPGSRGRNNSAIAKAILVAGISVFSFIIIKLCVLLLRRKYRERMRGDYCCEGMSSRMRRRRHQSAVRFRQDPTGCESQSRPAPLQTDSTRSCEVLPVISPPQPQENEEPLAPPVSPPDNPLRSSDYAEYVNDVTQLPLS